MNIIEISDKIKQLFEEVYGEERVDVQCDCSTIDVLVHFPHFIIKNDIEETHDIYDFYMKMRFIAYSDKTVFTRVLFTRSTFTYDDVIKYRGDRRNYFYMHSHINVVYAISFMTMCIDSTSDVVYLMHKMEEGDCIDDIQPLLFSFNKIIEREDLDGMPYVRMNKGISGFYRKACPIIPDDLRDSIKRKVLEDMDSFRYTFDKDNNLNIIGIREKISEMKVPYKYKSYVINGVARHRRKNVDPPSTPMVDFTFKGSKVKFKFVDNRKRLPLHPHPMFVENVAESIESDFLNYLSINSKL